MRSEFHKPSVARNYFQATLSIIAVRETDPKIHNAVRTALITPTAESLCAVVQATRNTPWFDGVVYAIAVVGMSAATAVLGTSR